jgi:hypothetical protein
MALSASGKIWLYKDVFDRFKVPSDKVEKRDIERGYYGAFRSGDNLLLTDNATLSYVPLDKIRNSKSLGLEGLADWPGDGEGFDFLDENNYASIGEVGADELGNFLIKESISGEVRGTKRKLYRHECNQSVQNCSIARGMLLGRNYDHCGNCFSNEGKYVDKVNISLDVSMIIRDDIGKRNLFDEKPNAFGCLKYLSLVNNDTLKWVGGVFGNAKMNVYYFGKKSDFSRGEVDDGKGKEFLKERLSEPRISKGPVKLVYSFEDGSDARIFSMPVREKEEKVNWPED